MMFGVPDFSRVSLAIPAQLTVKDGCGSAARCAERLRLFRLLDFLLVWGYALNSTTGAQPLLKTRMAAR